MFHTAGYNQRLRAHTARSYLDLVSSPRFVAQYGYVALDGDSATAYIIRLDLAGAYLDSAIPVEGEAAKAIREQQIALVGDYGRAHVTTAFELDHYRRFCGGPWGCVDYRDREAPTVRRVPIRAQPNYTTRGDVCFFDGAPVAPELEDEPQDPDFYQYHDGRRRYPDPDSRMPSPPSPRDCEPDPTDDELALAMAFAREGEPGGPSAPSGLTVLEFGALTDDGPNGA